MNKKREPLLSGDVIPVKLRSPEEVDAMHEKARAKDAELIQKLVDALDWYVKEDDVMEGGEWDEMNAPWIEGRNEAEKVLAAAEAEGFKPTDQ